MLPSGEVALYIGDRGLRRRPEARPGGSRGSKIARGGLQRGVLSLRTSEFWRPVLGDLEAKNLDSLEDYNLVAKNPSPQQPGGPTRGPADYAGASTQV